MKERSILARNIIARRKARHWNQEELAHKVGVHLNIIKKIEADRGEGELATRKAIAGALNCTLSDLYFDPEEAPPIQVPVHLLKPLIDAPQGILPAAGLAVMLEEFADAAPEVRSTVLSILFDDDSISAPYLPKSGKA